METPKEKTKTVHVSTDKKVETVEKYFKQLDFKHQVRLAVECLADECIRNKSDAKLKAKFNKGSFTITIELDEDEY